MPYRYDRLPTEHIRLLSLDGDLDRAPIQTRSFDRHLDERLPPPRLRMRAYGQSAAPPYTAISYTWGGEDANRIVLINGQQFLVKPNLWSCLHYMVRSGWDYLWVDAVCINQNDDAEKSQQVKIMDQIYRKATVVSVWLGLPQLPDGIRFTGEPILTIDYDEFDWRETLVDLANRPYWSRMWVIQETLVASEVHLYCGNSRVDWVHFKTLLQDLVSSDLLYSDNIDSLSRSTASTQFKALPLALARHPDRHPELYHPLYDLLLNHARSVCKDPRDRVFALLSLTPPDERFTLSSGLPNYALSHENVVLIVLSYFVEFCGKDLKSEPDDLFMALGLKSRGQRRQMILATEHFFYPIGRPPFAGPFEMPWVYHSSANVEHNKPLVAASTDPPIANPSRNDLWSEPHHVNTHLVDERSSRRIYTRLCSCTWYLVIIPTVCFGVGWLVVYLRNPSAGWWASAQTLFLWVVRKARQMLNM